MEFTDTERGAGRWPIMSLLVQVTEAVRTIRSENGIHPGKRIETRLWTEAGGQASRPGPDGRLPQGAGPDRGALLS